MRKALLLCLITLSFACVTNTGCTLTGGNIILPDVASLTIRSVSTFVPGDSATVTLYSYTLTPGPYLLHYNLSGANVSNGDTAIVYLNDSIATFSTHLLANPGNTTLTLTMITNSSGGYATLSKHNTMTFSDSIGLMTATFNDTGAYKAMHVTATLTGTLLTIQGTYWKPLTTVTLNVDNYAHTTGPVYFNAHDITNANGNALYTTPTKTDSSQHGVITITNTTPLITGTFSFTNKDSSTISSGTFSCVAP